MSEPWWSVEFAATLAAERAISGSGGLGPLATLLAAHGSPLARGPEVVVQTQRRLDALALGIGPGHFEAWHRRLFVDEGFAGNGAAYHDPRNSFLPDVLERRVGIPISLAVVAIELAERCGLSAYGVGMPGHFLVGIESSEAPHETIYVDGFNGGTVLTEAGCAALFERLFGTTQRFDARYLAPVSTEQILIRMINNLKAIYARARNIEGLCDLARLRAVLPDRTLEEAREFVRLLGVSGRFADAERALAQARLEFPSARRELHEERLRLDALSN